MRIARLLRHRWFDESDSHRAIDRAAAARLTEHIAAGERRHRGEIRVCVEASLPLSALWRDHSARARALAMFGELRVWDTEGNNGVLIYVLLAERAIEIVADRAVARFVPADHWHALIGRMKAEFAQHRYEAGISLAIDAVADLLEQHFPLAPGEARANELPNRPLLR
ncbi:MAG: TPM domain-containing protein [Burkholderiales bacterium]|nr:TPM domain-containing protein [Burkholderiales bacterium]MDE2455127.1 TPM domain-containing protein [Burkholderiales bacterium]